MNKEQTQTKRWEVTIQKTATYDATIEVEADTEEQAQELAQAQAESGKYWGEFAENCNDETYEVTDSTCLSDD